MGQICNFPNRKWKRLQQKLGMFYKLKMLQSDIKLEKFKQGMIDSLKCIRINGNLTPQETTIHSLSLNNRTQDFKSQYRLFTVEGAEEEALCNISFVRQRNSFPCPHSKFRRKTNFASISTKPHVSRDSIKQTKKQKLLEIIKKIEKSKITSNVQTPQRLNNTDSMKNFFELGVNFFKKQRKQTPLIKIRGSLRINQKILGKRHDNMTAGTYKQYFPQQKQKQKVFNKTQERQTIQEEKLRGKETQRLCRWNSGDQFVETTF